MVTTRLLWQKKRLNGRKKYLFLNLRGGFVDGTKISVDDINNLAKLPALPVLHAQIITGINAPIAGVAGAFNAVLRSLATVLQAVKDNKEKSGG